jgi:hypothetical protein
VSVSESEQVYSAREVAQQLGLAAAMVRRYAAAYETASGEKIALHPRDGRLFSQKQLDVLLAARALVQRDSTSVEAAVSQVLARPETALAVRVTSSDALNLDALTAALSRSQQPLLDEVRQLRQEVAALRPPAETETTTEQPGSRERSDDDARGGLLVRAAMTIEQWLRRLRSD